MPALPDHAAAISQEFPRLGVMGQRNRPLVGIPPRWTQRRRPGCRMRPVPARRHPDALAMQLRAQEALRPRQLADPPAAQDLLDVLEVIVRLGRGAALALLRDLARAWPELTTPARWHGGRPAVW